MQVDSVLRSLFSSTEPRRYPDMAQGRRSNRLSSYSLSFQKKRGKAHRPVGDLVVEAPARFPQTSFCGTPRPSLGYEQFPTAFAIRTLPFAHPADSLVPFRFTEESRTH
jgi:hypothetical protein